MGSTSTISIDKHSAVDSLPHKVGNITSPELRPRTAIQVTFVDEVWQGFMPTLEYYRHLYNTSGYSPELTKSLLNGLSKSSLYEGEAS